MKILLADHRETSRTVATGSLARSGFEVVSVASWEECRPWLLRGWPDLAIMDLPIRREFLRHDRSSLGCGTILLLDREQVYSLSLGEDILEVCYRDDPTAVFLNRIRMVFRALACH